MDKALIVYGMNIELEVVQTALAVTDDGEKVAVNLVTGNEDTLDKVTVGSIIRTPDYDTLTITDFLDATYNYVNSKTGALKKTITNVNDIAIFEINLDELEQITAFVS